MTLNELRQTFHARTARMRDLLKEAGVTLRGIDQLDQMMSKASFDVAFVGEFTAGKSSVINALLEAEILPTKLEPTTARITYLSYADAPEISLTSSDGTKKHIPYSSGVLQRYIASNKELVEGIKHIAVDYPSELLKNGVRFIDTPGTNDIDEQRVAITYDILPGADAVVYVTIYPVTDSNLTTFKTHVIENGLKNVFFLLNKKDLLDGVLPDAVTDATRWFSECCGRQVQLMPISAIDYMEGALSGDVVLKEKSGFGEFKTCLATFLGGSEKFAILQEQYKFQLEKCKQQAIALVETKAASYLLSDEEYKKRIAALQDQIGKSEAEAKELAEDVSVEVDRLVNKLESSLDGLIEQILEAVDMTMDQQGGDDKLLMRNVESGVRGKFEGWKSRNDTIVRDFLTSIRDEIKARLGKTVGNLQVSLQVYQGKTSLVEARNLVPSGQGGVDGILADENKSRAAIGIASAGSYIALSFIGLGPLAPLGLLIAPIGYYLLGKAKEQKRAALKAELLSQIHNNSTEFKRRILAGIAGNKDNLHNEIERSVRDITENLRAQMSEVNRERESAAADLEGKSNRLREIIGQLQGI